MSIVNKSINVGQTAVQSYEIAKINVIRFYMLYNLLLSHLKSKVKKCYY